MNDSTPRKYKGTLLERAAARYAHDLPVAIALPDEARAKRAARNTPLTQVPPAESQPSPTPPSQASVEEAPPAPATPDQKAQRIEDTAPPRAVPSSGRELVLAPASKRTIAIDRDRLAAKGMLVPGAAVSVLAEEMRLVKRQLLITSRAVAVADDDRSRMVLVCSARPDEGKTFCAINLAISMAAESDLEILLVDADFAKPDVLATLGAEPGPGLLDALSDPSLDVEELILATDVPHLSILPAGRKSQSDTELLASRRGHRILETLAADPGRIVIFDSPPALSASPASVLAMHVGQVMMVVRADRTSEPDLREAVHLLDRCEHIQLCLNRVTFSPGGHRFGSYYEGDRK